jgi:uncharacterized protein (DUF885 family)
MTLQFRLTITCLSALSLTMCVSTVTTPQPADETVKSTINGYVLGFLARNPMINTYLGGAGLDPSLAAADGRLRDNSPAAIDEEDEWLRGLQRSLETAKPETLAPQTRIDRDVALAQIRFQLHLHEARKYQQRSVDTYTDEPFRAIDFQLQGLTQTGPDTYGIAEEWRLVAERLAAIPRYLATAEEQLRAGIAAKNTPDHRMLYRHGIVSAAASAKYFDNTLPQLAAERITGPEGEKLLTDIRARSPLAAAACRHFRDFVASTFFDDPTSENGIKAAFAGDHFPSGEAEYDWALKNNLQIHSTAAELYESSWATVLKTQGELIALARQIGQSHGWTLPADDLAATRFVFDQLSNDYPKSDAEMFAWYRQTAMRLVDFARRTGMFDVPADYKLDIVETPPPLRAAMDGAGYYPAPPFKKTGVGRFYLNPTGNDPAVLRMNNRASLADLTAHEGFPGHDWYYKVMSLDPPSPVRWLTPGEVEGSSSMWEDSMSAEGWGLYAESLVAEPQPGTPDGFYTPEERLYQLQGKLYRDLRVRIDTGIHTGRISYADAVDLYSTVVDFLPGSCRDANASTSDAKRASCSASEGAIFRYSKWPTQAITYRIGRDEIYRLRDETARALGPKFDLKRFHLAFIRQGSIPPGYFAGELLKELGAK